MQKRHLAKLTGISQPDAKPEKRVMNLAKEVEIYPFEAATLLLTEWKVALFSS